MHNFRNSLLRLSLFSVLPLLVIAYAIYLTGKNTGDFYKRFTSPPQNSLILGSSRGSSINPAILDSIVQSKYPDVKFYNYAFTWGHSPYGPKYLESIKKKLDPNTKNGLFILVVEPTSLMVDRTKPDEPSFYFENDKSVAKTKFVNISPNLEYLVESYDYSITYELNKKIIPPKNPMVDLQILDNGKMQVTMIKDFPPKQRAEVNKQKMQEFRERINGLKWSTNRVNYLEETIVFLKNHGKVIMVRTPINKVPYNIENTSVPYFDIKLNELAKKTNVSYINYNNYKNNYHCIDEVHLSQESMTRFSKELGKLLFEEKFR